MVTTTDSVLQELLHTTLDSYGGSMEAYISKFAGYHHELVEKDARLPDRVEASWLLGSLDSKFDNCVHTSLFWCVVASTFDAFVSEKKPRSSCGTVSTCQFCCSCHPIKNGSYPLSNDYTKLSKGCWLFPMQGSEEALFVCKTKFSPTLMG